MTLKCGSRVSVLVKKGPAPYGDLSMADDEVLKYATPTKPMTIRELAADHPGDCRVYIEVARGLVRHEKFAEAQREMDKVCAVDRDFVTSMEIDLADGLHDWKKAIMFCTDYIDRFQHSSLVPNWDRLLCAFTTRARAYRTLKNYDAAIADFTTLNILDPGSAETYRDRADCYMEKNKVAEAIADYSLAIQYDPDKLPSKPI